MIENQEKWEVTVNYEYSYYSGSIPLAIAISALKAIGEIEG